MRIPNFKVGWIVQNKIAALTHFHSEITPEDIYGVMQASQKLLKDINQDFHMIIDNRVAPLSRIYTLAELQESAPILAHPYLNHLIIIKPVHLSIPQNQVEISNRVKLRNVSSIQEAFDFFAKQYLVVPHDLIEDFFSIPD